MTYTVPSNLSANPTIIIVGGVRYALGAGETVDVPAEVITEFNRMQASAVHTAPPVELPFKDTAQEKEIQGLDTRMTAVEAAVAQKELPDFPETDGAYSLQAEVDEGETTLTWEAVETTGT